MKKDLNSLILTKNELEIMEVIWAKGETTVKDVFAYESIIEVNCS